MKAKIFITLIIAIAISCSPKEEKKDTSTELSDQENKEETPTEESAPEEETDVPEEEIVTEEEAPTVVTPIQNPNNSPKAGISDKESGSENGSGVGPSVKSKGINAKSDITVGEEGVR